MKSNLVIFLLIISQFANAQIQQDSILIEREINEVKISVAKTLKSIEDLPIPAKIIDEQEIKHILSVCALFIFLPLHVKA